MIAILSIMPEWAQERHDHSTSEDSRPGDRGPGGAGSGHPGVSPEDDPTSHTRDPVRLVPGRAGGRAGRAALRAEAVRRVSAVAVRHPPLRRHRAAGGAVPQHLPDQRSGSVHLRAAVAGRARDLPADRSRRRLTPEDHGAAADGRGLTGPPSPSTIAPARTRARAVVRTYAIPSEPTNSTATRGAGGSAAAPRRASTLITITCST